MISQAYHKPNSHLERVKVPSHSKLRLQQTASHIMTLLLKQKVSEIIKNTFNHLKQYSKKTHQNGTFLLTCLKKISAQKQLQHQKELWSRLLNNSVLYLVQRNQKIEHFKRNSKEKAANLIGRMLKRAEHQHTLSVFSYMKSRSNLKSLMNSYKTQILINWCESYNSQHLMWGFQKIRYNLFTFLSKIKQTFVLEQFAVKKKKDHLKDTMSILKSSKANEQPNTPEMKLAKGRFSGEDLAEQKRLENELRKCQEKLRELKKEKHELQSGKEEELNKLTEELQSLKFTSDALSQENLQLEANLQDQKQSKEQERPLQQGITAVHYQQYQQLSESKIWEALFNRFVKFLFKKKIEKQENDPGMKTLSLEADRQEIIDNLMDPLLPSSCNIDEVEEENKILKELLDAYVANFPKPEGELQVDLLERKSLEAITREKRYIYAFVDKLSSWGAQGTQDVDNLRAELQEFKNTCE